MRQFFQTRSSKPRLKSLTGILLLGLSFQSMATERVSVSSTGVEADGLVNSPGISADGRFVTFYSRGDGLVAGDTNGKDDVFVRDRQTGVTTRVSVTSGGSQVNGHSQVPSISADGRYVAFQSDSSELIANDLNSIRMDVFLHDRQTGQTELVSYATDGTLGLHGNQGHGSSNSASISADGRYVVFESSAEDLVGDDSNGRRDIFVHDRIANTTKRISMATAGTQGDGHSNSPRISAGGRFVTFTSIATNLVAGDTNDRRDVFVHDLTTGQTTRVSVASDGSEANTQLPTFTSASITADGRYVVFSGRGIVVSGFPEPTTSDSYVYVHDRTTGQTTIANIAAAGAPVSTAHAAANERPTISDDGRFVAFTSVFRAVTGDTNIESDVFVRDRVGGKTIRVSLATDGTQGNYGSGNAVISSDGKTVIFLSLANNLVPNDTNLTDAFVNDVSFPATPNDFNGDGKSDILWRHAASNGNMIYLMNGNTISSQPAFAHLADPAWVVAGSSDFNGDGKTDILWRHSTGANQIALMNGGAVSSTVNVSVPTLAAAAWQIAGIGDFNGDGNDDIFWHNNATADNQVTLMNGTAEVSTTHLNTIANGDTGWYVAGVADFNQDGKDDVIWRHDVNKRVWMYLMNGASISNGGGGGEHVVFTAANWNIDGVGDFNADGRGDILWRNSSNGRVWVYFMNGTAVGNGNPPAAPGEHVAFSALVWDIKAVGDYNGDGKSDIFWRHSTQGWNHMYLMNGATPAQQLDVNSLPDLIWKVK